MRKYYSVLLCMIMAVFLACGCGKKNIVTETTAVETTETVTKEQETTEPVTTEEATTEELTTAAPKDVVVVELGNAYYDLEHVIMYINTYKELPANYITKKEAKALGWEGGSVEKYMEGAAIGGDYFGNYEEILPTDKKYTECDIDTLGANGRGAKRLIFSNDYKYFYTSDHYESFTEYVVENGQVKKVK